MRNRTSQLCLALGLSVSPFMTIGCARNEPAPSPETGSNQPAASAGAETDYNPHDVPITEEQKQQLRQEAGQFASAIAKIKQFRDETEEETKAGIPQNPYKAHQALDQADLVLQWLPEIASTSNIPKAHWEEVTTTANDLRGLFEKVHQNIDNKQNPDFASVADEIDAKIAQLEKIAEVQPPTADESNPDNG